jgi:hypothetical protein
VVSDALEISGDEIEPSVSIFASDLLSDDDARSAGADESEPFWPEVSIIGFSSTLAGAGPWLTRERACEDRPFIGPSSVAQGPRPDPDPVANVNLSVAGDVSGLEISNGSFIDNSWSNLTRSDKVASPCVNVWIDVAVQRRRQRLFEHERPAINAQESRRRSAVLHVECEIARDHRLRCPRRRGQTWTSQRRDLSRLERSRRDLTQDLRDDTERAHENTSTRSTTRVR